MSLLSDRVGVQGRDRRSNSASRHNGVETLAFGGEYMLSAPAQTGEHGHHNVVQLRPDLVRRASSDRPQRKSGWSVQQNLVRVLVGVDDGSVGGGGSLARVVG